jgi:hypothetical protein
MAGLMRTLGRFTGHVMKTQAFNTASKFIAFEMKLADLRIKIRLLKQNKRRHLLILGRTIYRLNLNGVEITENSQVNTLIRVITEIQTEIDIFKNELIRRQKK